VIVVIGSPGLILSKPKRSNLEAVGTAARIAFATADAGADVQLVAKLADDQSGDEIVLALSRRSVGHAALLRVPSRLGDQTVGVLEEGDLELALQYLADFRVVILTEPLSQGALRIVAAAASYAGAYFILVLPAGAEPEAAPDATTILEAPTADPYGAFAGLVGRYAAALDRGVPAEEAFRDATRSSGRESAAR
jgi:sugar/nucleoside kinase (ribokinase family)